MITTILGYIFFAWFFMSLGIATNEYVLERMGQRGRGESLQAAISEALYWPVGLFNYIRGK